MFDILTVTIVIQYVFVIATDSKELITIASTIIRDDSVLYIRLPSGYVIL